MPEPYWIAVSEWLAMPKAEQEDIQRRHCLIGGAMKVFATEEEANVEREKQLKDIRY